MQQIFEPTDLSRWADAQHQGAQRIGFVPTMGALHEGHLTLIRTAREQCDRVVVSIFVNPTQFGPSEDLDRYPRDLEGDLAKLRTLNVDVVFTPNSTDIYPPNFDTYVVPQRLAQTLCGATRPGHFQGVATIVTILLRITRCDVAYFGQKDFQQLRIIQQMAQDLWLDVEVVGLPIVREKDGLAMSSRNAYLSPAQRREALALRASLKEAQRLFLAGERNGETLRKSVMEVLADTRGLEVEYASAVDAQTLQPVEGQLDQATLVAVAGRLESTRLIDNVLLIP